RPDHDALADYRAPRIRRRLLRLDLQRRGDRHTVELRLRACRVWLSPRPVRRLRPRPRRRGGSRGGRDGDPAVGPAWGRRDELRTRDRSRTLYSAAARPAATLNPA